MERTIRVISRISERVGQAAAWLILPLSTSMGYEVIVRYVFLSPTTWAFDTSIILFGTYFMLASAYTLSRDAHVRGDIFYRNFSPRTQAIIDLALYILVFFPAMIALVYVGADFFWRSWVIRETSAFSPYRRPIYPLKAMIPLSAFLLLLQGVAQVLRCIITIRTGRWPDGVRTAEEETV